MNKKKILYASIPLAEAALILYLCCFISPADIESYSLPPINLPIPTDKIVHYIMYLTLCAGWLFSYTQLFPKRAQWHNLLIICILPCIIFGGIIEIIQLKYCPGRSGDWYDFLANSLGAITAFILTSIILYYKKTA